MAKTGSIVATEGSQTGHAVVAAVAQSEPRVSNLSSVAKDALVALTSGLGIAIVDLANRKVHVTLDVEGVRDEIAEFDGLDVVTLAPASEGSTVPFEIAGGSHAALQIELDPQPPRYSVASLISMIEDVLEGEGQSGIIIVDQANGNVVVHCGSPANANTAADALATTLAASSGALKLATFDQTVDTATGPKPFGE